MVLEIPESLVHEMVALQRRAVDEGSQVLVIFEGSSGRIIGRVINEFMNVLDPRGTAYAHFIPEDIRSPRDIMGFIRSEPAKGKIAIYDRSWYSWMKGGDGVTFCTEIERYLTDNGVIIVKIFLNISEDSLDDVAKLFGSRKQKDATFLTDDHVDISEWGDQGVMPIIARTSTINAPWDIVDVKGLEQTMSSVFSSVITRVKHAMDNGVRTESMELLTPYRNPREDADLDSKMKGYKKELEVLSLRVAQLQTRLASSGRSLVLVFEGWDAAGKGGSIKRLVRAFNPRGYHVRPVAAPVGEERVHTYLWRFSMDMPDAGHIVVFDRSWYGRMMVEPIEGLCSDDEYARSATEINNFERMIHNTGGIVIKFWMEISPEEQLRRFNDRAENPLKQWKITDEDWRNREKWDVYEEYIDRMMSSTNTSYAPWVVVESEDKKYGRIKVLRTVVETLERELN